MKVIHDVKKYKKFEKKKIACTKKEVEGYKQYLNEIPGYNVIEKLKTYQNYFNNDNIEKLNKIKKQIEEALYKVYIKL